VDVRSFFIANAKPAKLIEPGKSSFYHPTPLAQAAAVFGVSPGEPRPDPANS
jgi:hypothetical protein